ncbi:MAG: TRZ/ATZ family hydrolase [Pseudomonadota bacterium]
MEKVDQIIHAKWLITCEPDNKVLTDHALIIHQGLIKNIIPSASVAKKYQAADTQEFKTHAVMPGFINTHTHIPMNLFRGLMDDLALMDWLNNYIWPAEKKWVDSQFVYDASLLAMGEMIRGGTTCFNDMYFFSNDTARAAELSGMRAHIGITIIDVPTRWAKTTAEYMQKGLAFYEEYKNHPHIKITLAPHAIYTVPDNVLVEIRDVAEKFDLKINMHIQESRTEALDSIAKTQHRPLKRLNDLGLVTPRLIAVHMTDITEEDLEILAVQKPNIVHCPESNMKLASGIAPLDKFKIAGLNVALGTDGAASNNDLDMIGEMRTAALLAKASTHNPTSLKASEALQMATLNGAKALGIEKVTGSLSVGKSADFIAIKLDELETLPVYYPESQIVYSASRSQVTDVFVAGKQLLRKRELLTLDEEKLKANAQEWREKIGKS